MRLTGPARTDPAEATASPSADVPWALAAAGLLAAAGWGLWLSHASGGRAGLSLASALACLVPLLVVSRPWRVLPTWSLVAALGPGLCALASNAISATGWQGLDDAASWLYAGLLGLAVAAAGSTAQRRMAVLLVVVAVGLDQAFQAWWAWFGGGTATAPWVGTYFWHNSFAGFMLAPASIALVLAGSASGRPRALGVVLAPVLGAAIVLSGSRAATLLLVAIAVVVAAATVRNWGAAVRLAAVAAAVPLVARVLTLSVGSGSGSGALGSRVESAGSSLGIRIDYFTAAWQLWLRHPVQGAGFGSFESAGQHLMPAESSASALVHNGWLQALTDGGLLLAVPVVLVTGWLLWAAARLVLTRARLDVTRTAAAAAVLTLGAHALFDFDWDYPALLAAFAIVGAVLVAPERSPTPESSAGPARAVAVLTGVAVVLALGSSVLGAAQQAPLSMLGPVGRLLGTTGLVQGWAAGLPTDRVDLATMRRLVPADAADRARLEEAFDRTARAAADDPVLAQARALALVRLGRVPEGLQVSEAAFPDQPRPSTVEGRADVLVAAGQRPAAVALVRSATQEAVPGTSALLTWLQQKGETTDETPEGSGDDVPGEEAQ